MLSYRHAFHAGNHADCLKHLILTRVLTYLAPRPDAAPGSSGITPVLGASPGVAPCTPGIPPVLGGKDKPLCYCETHAGPGLYALDSPQAQQNQEYLGGIARLWGRQDLHPSLAAYLALVRDCNGPGELRRYPGSPWLAQRLLRPVDRLILHELHSAEIGPLRNNFAGDRRVQVIAGDGYRGLRAAVPPRERRGLVLIDPAYEVKTDYRQVIEALSQAHRRFATGVYALWYPVVERGRIDALERAIARSGIRRVQRYELAIRNEGRGSGMAASGMVVVNPPWTLLEDLRPALDCLAQALGEGGQGGFRAEELVGE
jgi:23S rRNA (adenine2030-N6)-methyltransferase